MSPSNKIKIAFALLAAFLCADHSVLFAQMTTTKKLLFESITIEDGLSQGMVTRIIQDRYGFMWFATKDGLNRYDGYNFVVYRHDATSKTSLADNYVYTVFEDSKGRLWVGTASQGLDLFDRATETFLHFKHDEANAQSICDNIILAITEDKSGTVYVSTANGLCSIEVKQDKSGKESYSFAQIDSRHYCKVIAPHKDRIWIAPSDASPYARETNGSKIAVPQTDMHGTPIGSLLKTTQAFAHDSIRHVLYFIGSHGMVRYDEGKHQYERIASDSFSLSVLGNPSLLDMNGILWGSMEGSLSQYNVSTHVTSLIETDNKSQELMLKSANCFFRDRSGVLWIGTAGYGMLKYNAQAEKFHHTGNESVRWLREDKRGNIMVVTRGDVAWLFDKKLGRFTGCVPDSSFIGKAGYRHSLDAIEQDEQGNYWIGKQVFLRYDPVSKTTKDMNIGKGFAFPLWQSGDGLIWMGTDSSFSNYNKKTGVYTHYSLPVRVSNEPYKFIQAITAQNESVFWLGTINGLFRFDKHTTSWRQYKNLPADTTSLSFDLIFSLYPDPVHPKQYLWVGTNGGGFNRFDMRNGKCLRYSTKDGLPNNVVYGILSDQEGNLWMSANKGLSQFTPATKQFRNYEAKDGLQSNEFNRYAFCKAADGTLFFGGVNGFNYFLPQELNNQSVAPNIVLTDLKIGNKSIAVYGKKSPLQEPIYLTEKLRLRYDDNMVSFEFAALDFAQPLKNQYRYKLEGFDKEWIEAGTQHAATYTNLDPGTYTFRVTGSNSDNVWSKASASLQIIILPPWYMTWWLRAAVVLVLSSVGYGFYRYRLSQALKVYAIRNRIARDLHDEIGSNMSNILIFSNIAHQKTERTNATAPLLQKITEYTQLSMDAMSDIVWMINTRNDRFENIVVRMQSLAAELFEATSTTLHLHFDDRLAHIKLNMEERKNFYLLYKEAINNVAKYAASSDVWIDLDFDKNEIVLKIADNGKGFNVDQVMQGNGLFNMRNRAALLKANLNISSVPGNGTIILLRFKAS